MKALLMTLSLVAAGTLRAAATPDVPWPATFDDEYAACVEKAKPKAEQIGEKDVTGLEILPAVADSRNLSDDPAVAFDSFARRAYPLVWQAEFWSTAPGFLLFLR